MISSMTAFAREAAQGDFGNLSCEMRSINHRYLEVSVYLPDALRALEMPIRERIRQYLNRGKVECNFRYQMTVSEDASLTINKPLAKVLCLASEEIAAMLGSPAPIQPATLLRFPGIFEKKEMDVSVLQAEVLSLVDAALKELVAARQREGEELKRLFLQRMEFIDLQLAQVRKRLPQVMQDQKDRLIKRFTEASIDLDPARLEQEMVIFAQKIDVAEEIDRAETHLTEMRRILKEGGVIGRRLDFLLQELNREANTLGSKSVDPVVTHAAVEMKVLIEQVREQVQNVE